MKNQGKRQLILGSIFSGIFIIWTLLIQVIDVQPIGADGSEVGFATING